MGFDSDFQIPDSSGQCQNSFIKVNIFLFEKILVCLFALTLFSICACLQVWSDSTENDENLLVTGCGSTAPAVVTAPRNVMKARFQSTETAGKGFSASFYTSVYHMVA